MSRDLPHLVFGITGETDELRCRLFMREGTSFAVRQQRCASVLRKRLHRKGIKNIRSRIGAHGERGQLPHSFFIARENFWNNLIPIDMSLLFCIINHTPNALKSSTWAESMQPAAMLKLPRADCTPLSAIACVLLDYKAQCKHLYQHSRWRARYRQ